MIVNDKICTFFYFKFSLNRYFCTIIYCYFTLQNINRSLLNLVCYS